MRIQNNISALNAHRRLGINTNAQAKNLEKLSSGYRINRAADDAAGLAISEKMRSQIRGLEMASRNAQDGVSLVQTAEGYLQETHEILQRMRELSIQASSETLEEGQDTERINEEITQLKEEVNRIAETASFNNKKLLDGSLAGAGSATNGFPVELEVGKALGSIGGLVNATAGIFTVGASGGLTVSKDAGVASDHTLTLAYTDKHGEDQVLNITMNFEGDGTQAALTGVSVNGEEVAVSSGIKSNGETFETASIGTVLDTVFNSSAGVELRENFTITPDGEGAFTFTAKDLGSNGAKILSFSEMGGVTQTANTGTDAYQTLKFDAKSIFSGAEGQNAEDYTIEVDGKKFMFVDTSIDQDVLDQLGKDGIITVKTAKAGEIGATDVANMQTAIEGATGFKPEVSGTDTLNFKGKGELLPGQGGLDVQIGPNNTDADRVNITIKGVSTDSLGITNIDLSTAEGAQAATDLIDKAISLVSQDRSALGAIQNRLEHTISNLGTTAENLSAAEARIRDVDMAKEMMELTKNNILTQAAQSMLAQANQQPQGILQLLG